jgi:hypothetical protein
LAGSTRTRKRASANTEEVHTKSARPTLSLKSTDMRGY